MRWIRLSCVVVANVKSLLWFLGSRFYTSSECNNAIQKVYNWPPIFVHRFPLLHCPLSTWSMCHTAAHKPCPLYNCVRLVAVQECVSERVRQLDVGQKHQRHTSCDDRGSRVDRKCGWTAGVFITSTTKYHFNIYLFTYYVNLKCREISSLLCHPGNR